MFPLWRPEDSDALDREVRVSRQPVARGPRKTATDPYASRELSGAELKRRAQADKAIRRVTRLERGASKPRLLANGRWEARRRINGQRFVRRFDTEAQAQDWLDNININIERRKSNGPTDN